MNIIQESEAYNERRYGLPWGAIVTFDGTKPVLNFSGNYLGKRGYAGKLIIDAEIGQVVAFGQKDNRGNNTRHDWYLVGENGELTEISRSDAFEHYSNKKNQLSNPLEKFSDEELLAEIKRRGVK